MSSLCKTQKLWKSAVALLISASFCGTASADEFPNKPIRLTVAYSAGSSMDLIARLISQPLQAELGQAVVVENRPGAGGTVGTEHVANSPADGYTLVIGTPSNMVTAPLANKASRYDLKRFRGIGLISSYYFLVATANLPQHPKTLIDLTERLKNGKDTFAASGVGTVVHLTGLRYMNAAGVKATHVPYQGSGQVLTDVAAGHVLFSTETVASSLPLVEAGRVRALAVTSPKRLESLPDVPTVAEKGYPGFEVQSWAGIWAPAATPLPVVTKLNHALSKVLASETVRRSLVTMKMVPAEPMTVEAFDQFVASEVPGWVDTYKANIETN